MAESGQSQESAQSHEGGSDRLAEVTELSGAEAQPAPDPDAPDEEREAAGGGRRWFLAAVVLLVLLAGSLTLNWMQYQGTTALQAEATGLGASLVDVGVRADRAEAELSALRGVVRDVHGQLLALQDTLADLTRVTGGAAAPAVAAETPAAVEPAAATVSETLEIED